MSISAKAPHPAAARLFTAWFFTPEGAKAVAANQNRPTLKNIPDERTSIPKLRETSWWTPIPQNGHWVPDEKDWEANYDDLMPDMRKAFGLDAVGSASLTYEFAWFQSFATGEFDDGQS